jgi:hypothetical protein
VEYTRTQRSRGTACSSRSRPRRLLDSWRPIEEGRFPGFNRHLYYGLGIVIAHGWQFQNPEMQGYTAISAYLPSRRIALALTVTKGKAAAATQTNYSELLFSELTKYLTPDHAVVFPGIERQPQPK